MNKKSPKKLVLCTETLRNLNEKDLLHAVGALAAAARGHHLDDKQQVGCVVGAHPAADRAPRDVLGHHEHVRLADPGRGADVVRPAGVKLVVALNCLRRCGAGASTLGASWPDAA